MSVPETIQELALHFMAELWVGSGGGGGVLLEPPERRSCRKHHLLGETEDKEGGKRGEGDGRGEEQRGEEQREDAGVVVNEKQHILFGVAKIMSSPPLNC